MKKFVSILLILAICMIFGSCEQARTVVVKYNSELTHYYSRHTADLDKVKDYIAKKGGYEVGSSFKLSIYGRNDEVCIEEADRQAKLYFDNAISYFSNDELSKLLGEETEFEYSFCRVQDNGDTIKVASYQYNME